MKKLLSVITMALMVIAIHNAQADAECKEITVPFTWTLTITGDPFASAYVDNTGPMGTSISDSDALSGNFVISYVHAVPSDYCSRLDPLPTSVTLNVITNWTGSLSNSTLALDPWGVSIDTYVKSNAVISAPGLPAFTPTPEQIGSATSKDINQTKNLAFAVGAGNTPYSGSVDIQTLFGFGSGTLGDFATGAAYLSISGNLINPTQNIRYLVPVPEPSATLLMGLGIIGIGCAKRRKVQSFS